MRICLLASLVLALAGCGGGSPSTETNSLGEPVVQGKQGDAAVTVVYVQVNGFDERVPCVLYNGYRSVAIDCLDPRVP